MQKAGQIARPFFSLFHASEPPPSFYSLCYQILGPVGLSQLPHEIHLLVNAREGESRFLDQQESGVEQQSRAAQAEADRNERERRAGDRDQTDRHAGSDKKSERGVKARQRSLQQP